MSVNSTELLSLIARDKWSQVLDAITSDPNLSHTKDDMGELPLHRACAQENVPVEVIEAFVKIYPQALEETSKTYGGSAIFIAVGVMSSTLLDVVKNILKHNKEAATVINDDKRTVLSHHIWKCPKPNLEVVKLLVVAYPEAVRMSDKFAWYPLHCAGKCGSWSIAKYLIDLYPDVLQEQSRYGYFPRDIANMFCEHKLRDKLIEEEKQRFGTIAAAKGVNKKYNSKYKASTKPAVVLKKSDDKDSTSKVDDIMQDVPLPAQEE